MKNLYKPNDLNLKKPQQTQIPLDHLYQLWLSPLGSWVGSALNLEVSWGKGSLVAFSRLAPNRAMMLTP